MTLARCLLTACAVLLVAAPSATAGRFTINVRGSADSFGRVLAIGDFKPERDPTVGAAMVAYGEPSTVRHVSTWGCRVSWHSLGVKVLFANFGGGGACDDDFGRAQAARAYGDRWRTAKGLRVGARLPRLRRLYPNAAHHGRAWWLVTAFSPFGDGGRYPVMKAIVRGARVRSFTLWVGAAGE